MEYELKGTLKTILPVQSGTSKAGKEWKKVNFIVANNDGYEGKEQEFAFQVFGGEKVDKFIQHNAEGSTVNVKFNIRCNEYNGNYFTNLEAWRVESGEAVEQLTNAPFQATPSPVSDDSDDSPLPF